MSGCLAAGWTETDGSLFVVMELASGGALDVTVDRPMMEKLLLLLDVACALEYLHAPDTSRRLRVIHRDLK